MAWNSALTIPTLALWESSKTSRLLNYSRNSWQTSKEGWAAMSLPKNWWPCSMTMAGKWTGPSPYRFRGQESRAFLSYFPALLYIVFSGVKMEDRQKLKIIHQASILCRRLVSLSVPISDITNADLVQGDADAKALSKLVYAHYKTIPDVLRDNQLTKCFIRM